MQGDDQGKVRVPVPMEIGDDEMARMHNAVMQAIACVKADEEGLQDGADVDIPGGLILGVLAYVAARILATAPERVREDAIKEFTATMREHMGPSITTN